MESGLDMNRQNLLRNSKVFLPTVPNIEQKHRKAEGSQWKRQKQKKAGRKQKVEARATKVSRKQAGKKAESRSKKFEKLSKEPQTESKGIHLGQWGKR